MDEPLYRLTKNDEALIRERISEYHRPGPTLADIEEVIADIVYERVWSASWIDCHDFAATISHRFDPGVITRPI